MLYVSAKLPNNMVCIKDTESPTTEYVALEDLRTRLAAGEKISGAGKLFDIPVRAEVASEMISFFSNLMKEKVDTYNTEDMYELARSCHFVRELQSVANETNTDLNALRECTYNNLTKTVNGSFSQVSKYTNSLNAVDVNNRNDVIRALMNNVCYVIQIKSTGALTSFCCTANIHIMDAIYGKNLIDKFYLTKVITPILSGSVRKPTEKESTPNPAKLDVFSCSLRFREVGKTIVKELSSPMYSVNIDRICALFILDNPKAMGDVIKTELTKLQILHSKDPEQMFNQYKFNYEGYQFVTRMVDTNTNIVQTNPKLLDTYAEDNLNGEKFEIAKAQFTRAWDYMQHLRKTGHSISKVALEG